MNAIISFFTSIGDMIVAVFDFTIKQIRDMVFIVKLFAEMSPVMPSFFTWLPAGLASMLGITIAVVVILRIIGRD